MCLAIDDARAEAKRASVTTPGQPLADILYTAPTQETSSACGDNQTPGAEAGCTCVKASLPRSSTFNKYVLFHQDIWSKEKQAYADKMFALWIAGSYLPMSVSKDPGAHRFLASVNSQVRCLKLNYLIITYTFCLVQASPASESPLSGQPSW